MTTEIPLYFEILLVREDSSPEYCRNTPSPDVDSIENLWSILARRVYNGGRQFAVNVT